MEYLFLACGSRGDTLPILEIAGRLSNKAKITIACNRVNISLASSPSWETLDLTAKNDEFSLCQKQLYELTTERLGLGHIVVGGYHTVGASRAATESKSGNYVLLNLSPTNYFSTEDPIKYSRFFPVHYRDSFAARRRYMDEIGLSVIEDERDPVRLIPHQRISAKMLNLFPEWYWGGKSTETDQCVGFVVPPELKFESSLEKPDVDSIVVYSGSTPESMTKLVEVVRQLRDTYAGKIECLGKAFNNVVDQVTFLNAIRSAKVLLHHGGIGTVAAAIRMKVPQLVIPSFHDQFDNAMRIERLGVGATIWNPDYNASEIQTKIDEISSSIAIADTLRFLAQTRFWPDAIEDASRKLEELQS